MTTGQTPHIYRVVELVGSSHTGIEDAIQNALHRASQTLRHLDWFEMKELRGQIRDGHVEWYQVKLGVGFRVEDAVDMHE